MGVYRSKNQKLITVQNEKFTKEYSEDDPYGMIRHSSNDRAAKELSPTAYKMFVKFALNKDGFQFALSPKALESSLGIKVSAYRNAVEELIERGYMIPIPDEEDAFIFMPNPPRAEALNADEPPVKCDTPPTESRGGENEQSVACPECEVGDYHKTEEPPVECEGDPLRKTEEPPVECEGQIIQYNTNDNTIYNKKYNSYGRDYPTKRNNYYNYNYRSSPRSALDLLLDDAVDELDMPAPQKRSKGYSCIGFDYDMSGEYNYDDDLPF